MGSVLAIAEGRPYEDLPKKQRAFIDQYVLSGDAFQAYLAAGYTEGKSARAKAAQMKSRLRTQIAQRARETSESVDMAILGMKVVRELAESAESEAVKLKAGMALMERGLPERPQEIHHTHDHTLRDLTEEEIDRRIARLRGDLAIDVSPESTAVS